MAETISHLNGATTAQGPQVIPIQTTEVPTYTIIQADGVYPDDVVEQEIFTANPPHPYKLNYVSTHLFPTGTPLPKPWSSIPKDLRDQVDGIMVLKMGFTAEDVELFPKLKV
ncbi:uncharacterized protein A1O5_01120 [Cladophialophora psammophila CBS 110553]|uniref:Uncharacterized protein n=1 Tax=Cladophialophora psammophila CBS 110553 TaxID=1182543 RepID=W9X805_9EURO|nr:uncharacterized protein A1O5_01120 [Cladophialophora psammophila CBS 110553]EXJ76612.1 hypothetical protein A1O5_01120 [Cladophialophora psammophila CBS 110553]